MHLQNNTAEKETQEPPNQKKTNNQLQIQQIVPKTKNNSTKFLTNFFHFFMNTCIKSIFTKLDIVNNIAKRINRASYKKALKSVNIKSKAITQRNKQNYQEKLGIYSITEQNKVDIWYKR